MSGSTVSELIFKATGCASELLCFFKPASSPAWDVRWQNCTGPFDWQHIHVLGAEQYVATDTHVQYVGAL